MKKNIGYVVGGSLTLGAGILFGSMIAASQKSAEVKPDRFSFLARVYDEKIGSSEKSVGLDDIRRNMVVKVSGRVLETCSGTGRNNQFYDGSKVTELILLDSSKEMLQESIRKRPKDIVSVKVVQSKDLSLFEDKSFDSVVDTFGICSVENPDAFLKDIKRVLKHDGKAFFLEHGRCESGGLVCYFMNKWLDFRAAAHSSYWGCLWNREISKLIEDAGFNIQSKEIFHYGTTTEIIATVNEDKYVSA